MKRDVSEAVRVGACLEQALVSAEPVDGTALRASVEAGRARKRQRNEEREEPGIPDGRPDAKVWASLRKRHDKGRDVWVALASYDNVYRILRDDPRVAAQLRRNTMTGTVYLRGAELSEHAGASGLAVWLADTYGISAALSNVTEAIVSVAEGNEFHPVRDYLRGLPAWDGKSRFGALLTKVLGCPHRDLYLLYVRRTVIAAVARAMRPGCKVDTATVLVGAQGIRKSTFWRVLFGRWFGDSDIEITRNARDAYMKLRLVWGYECAELETLNRAEAGEIKRFLSSCEDTYRAPYDRQSRQWPRHSVMVGSTNRPQFLVDPTGSRRFWPIAIPDTARIDTALLTRIRDQVWAEGLALYLRAQAAIDAGIVPDAECRWWFEPDEDEERAVDAEHFTVTDPREEMVLSWVLGRPDGSFTTAEVCEKALEMDRAHIDNRAEAVVRGILSRNGWEYAKRRWAGGDPRWRWGRRASTGEEALRRYQEQRADTEDALQSKRNRREMAPEVEC